MIPHSHPVLSCAEAKAWEAARLGDEDAEWAAMQRAGAGVGHGVLEDAREIGGMRAAARILVLAGKGHNGGDALLAARAILDRLGPSARADVLLVFGEASLRPLARRALQSLVESGEPGKARVEVSAGMKLPDRKGWDLCLDGVFGFQFRAPLEPPVAAFFEEVNARTDLGLRAAVDLPSGVGEVSAPVAFRADFTYATGIVKAPVLRPENAAHVGRLRYIDLGLVDDSSLPEAKHRILRPAILAPLAQLRPAQSDKRSYGHLFVVGGSHSYPGAVLLAVQAALRSGVGLLTAFVPEKFAPEYAARHPEAMWVGCPVNAHGALAAGALAPIQERLERADALLIGPGLSADPESLGLAGQLLGTAKIPAVLDADALRPEVAQRTRPGALICTPHAGEFKRLAEGRNAEDFSTEKKIVLTLKGPITRVVADGISHHSLFGGPVLARGGSGDMLAGLTAGLLAQAPDDLPLAAARGVVWHGLAADLLARSAGQVAVEGSQLLQHLGPALAGCRD